jgi:uncharacterized membrane protein YfcA
MGFLAAAFGAAVAAGSIASIAGFGIGSLLTPLVALRSDMRVAVAAVSIPHVIATALRFWLLRGHLDRRVFVRFGIASAAGGLAGALLQSRASNASLGIVLAALLILAAVSELFGLARRIRFGAGAAWIGGALSGVFGGLVGNQGGIRSAALLGFDLEKQSFVATATAVALLVDLARMPVYVASTGAALWPVAPLIAVMTVGVLVGTVAGGRLLRRIPEPVFRRLVAILLLGLAGWLLVRG